jgi:glycolate oxidase FAD binding subunit
MAAPTAKSVSTKTAAAPTTPLSFTEIVTPSSQAEVAELLRSAHADDTPIYPLGGRTALHAGLASKQPGLGLSTTGLQQVIDYPARDMTITVEAGITLAKLAEILAAENQFLPVDIAQAATATLGGAMALNVSGPRRFGYGTLRDYVIGVSAVDGRGTPFKAGGRVVKNVAGYDFCKLLTGSLGTLAVITQVTLKVSPRPAATALVSYAANDADHAEQLLASLATTATTPVAVELLQGKSWQDAPLFPGAAESPLSLVVGFAGTAAEVDWQIAQLDREWQLLGAARSGLVADAESTAAWDRLTEFGCQTPTPLVLKATVRSSRVTAFCKQVAAFVPQATILSHAARGIVFIDCGDLNSTDAAKLLIRDLRPLASASDGQVVVWNCPAPDEFTRQAFWGPTRDDDAVLRAVKNQFDPKKLLNPGRFIF